MCKMFVWLEKKKKLAFMSMINIVKYAMQLSFQLSSIIMSQ